MTRHVARAALLLGALAGAAAAQRGAPLLKADLIELLSNPLIGNQETADLVRRNCLAFRPTDRDWADIRGLGASSDVVASIAGCVAGRPAAAPAPAAAPVAIPPAPVTLQVVVRQPRIVAAAGSGARVVVLAALGGMPQPGVQLVLKGSGTIDGRSGRDVVVATDDSGFALFPLSVGRRLGTYRLEVAPAAGGTLPGRPIVELAVRPGPPATVSAEPREVLFEHGLDSIVPVAVLVRDSIGYPVGGEPVVLRSGTEGMGIPPDTAVTDSLGRARITVARSVVRRGGILQVVVRGKPLARVDVLLGMPLSEAGTGFLTPPTPGGTVHDDLGEPLVFEARTRVGHPAVGRVVTFRAANAAVSPATAMTDSAGRVRVTVTLGGRVGPATVVATIDSLEKRVTLQVEPGPAVELVLEHKGFRVDGRWVIVALDTTFVVRLRALDADGHPTSVANLARMLWENRAQFDARLQVARLLSAEEEQAAVVLTFRSVRPGRANLKITTAGISAAVMLDVVQVR
ncbi:MAG TPA: Ig-like domain-containing protein [Gemmatimonadales bacterium]|nr:Ig-like domain-containing protein [Gemmatimonadales bacterium]